MMGRVGRAGLDGYGGGGLGDEGTIAGTEPYYIYHLFVSWFMAYI